MRDLLFAPWHRCQATSGRVFAYDNYLCFKADGLAALVLTLPSIECLDDQRNMHGAIFFLVVFPSKVLLSIIYFPFPRWDQSLVSFMCSTYSRHPPYNRYCIALSARRSSFKM